MTKSGLMAIAALGGLLSAALVLLPITFPSLALLPYFAPLPLFFLGLSIGLRPLLEAGLLATICIFLFQGSLLTTEFFLLSFLGPTFLIQRALVNKKKTSGEVAWYSSSFLLRDITLFSGIIMIISLGIYLYLTQEKNLYILTKTIANTWDPQGNIKDIETLLITIFPFLPGFFTFSWMLMMLFNAAIAQGVLTRIKANLRPTPSFKTLQIPTSFLIVLGLALLLSCIGVGTLELLGKNAALTLTFPFFLSGIGIVHHLCHKTAFATVSLVIFYCALLLLLWPALFVILLGILRPWIEKFRATN